VTSAMVLPFFLRRYAKDESQSPCRVCRYHHLNLPMRQHIPIRLCPRMSGGFASAARSGFAASLGAFAAEATAVTGLAAATGVGAAGTGAAGTVATGPEIPSILEAFTKAVSGNRAREFGRTRQVHLSRSRVDGNSCSRDRETWNDGCIRLSVGGRRNCLGALNSAFPTRIPYQKVKLANNMLNAPTAIQNSGLCPRISVMCTASSRSTAEGMANSGSADRMLKTGGLVFGAAETMGRTAAAVFTRAGADVLD